MDSKQITSFAVPLGVSTILSTIFGVLYTRQKRKNQELSKRLISDSYKVKEDKKVLTILQNNPEVEKIFI